MDLTFAGVGSRKTSKNELILLKNLSKRLAELGFTLNSGGAPGADTACEEGADAGKGSKNIFLPWKNFNYNKSDLYAVSEQAIEMGRYYYGKPFPSQGVAKLMGRNCYQVLGYDLRHPVSFVLCCTPGGKKVGGTRQAITVAEDHDIPVFNIAISGDMGRLETHLRHLGIKGLRSSPKQMKMEDVKGL